MFQNIEFSAALLFVFVVNKQLKICSFSPNRWVRFSSFLCLFSSWSTVLIYYVTKCLHLAPYSISHDLSTPITLHSCFFSFYALSVRSVSSVFYLSKYHHFTHFTFHFTHSPAVTVSCCPLGLVHFQKCSVKVSQTKPNGGVKLFSFLCLIELKTIHKRIMKSVLVIWQNLKLLELGGRSWADIWINSSSNSSYLYSPQVEK